MNTAKAVATESSEDGGKATVPILPSDQPSVRELEDYERRMENYLRLKGVLHKVITANPEKTEEYADEADVPLPATDPNGPMGQRISMTNIEISRRNAKNDARWQEHLRSIRDQVAAILDESLRANAKFTLNQLKDKHKLAAPYAGMIDGGAMLREIFAKKGTLDVDDTHETAFKMLAYLKENPLPRNATPDQFAARCVEFDGDINPYLDLMKHVGKEAVKLMLGQMPRDLGADRRRLEREFDAKIGHIPSLSCIRCGCKGGRRAL